MTNENPTHISYDKNQGRKANCYTFFHACNDDAGRKAIEEEIKKHPHEKIGENSYFIFSDLEGAMLFMQLGVATPQECEAYLFQLSKPFRVWPQPEIMESIALRLPVHLDAMNGVIEPERSSNGVKRRI